MNRRSARFSTVDPVTLRQHDTAAYAAHLLEQQAREEAARRAQYGSVARLVGPRAVGNETVPVPVPVRYEVDGVPVEHMTLPALRKFFQDNGLECPRYKEQMHSQLREIIESTARSTARIEKAAQAAGDAKHAAEWYEMTPHLLKVYKQLAVSPLCERAL